MRRKAQEKKYECPKAEHHEGLILDEAPEDSPHNWRLSCGECGTHIKWASNSEADRIMSFHKPTCPSMEEVRAFVKAVFKSDKTQGYGYSGAERDADRFGNLPGKGKRWLTPAELALGFARRHHFETELFERSEDS
jgi:hypothetical protein